MNEEDIEPQESLKPSAEKIREARSSVRAMLREKPQKLRDLRQGMKEGRDLSADMDTCQGEIELLQKELQSIDEGGHTIFLKAKDLIAPKKEISAKKTKLREEIGDLQKEIEHLEFRLSLANLTDEQRSKLTLSISSKKETQKELEEEMEALRNFDHTRFVELRDERKRSVEVEEALEKIDLRLDELNAEMFEALEQVDESMIENLMLELNSLKEKKQKLLAPDGDPLLGDPEE